MEEGEPTGLTCIAQGDPEPTVSWSFQVSSPYTEKKDKDRKKSKVVAAAWGAESSHLFATLVAILHQNDLKNRMNCVRTI